jgi:squalene cyclase
MPRAAASSLADRAWTSATKTALYLLETRRSDGSWDVPIALNAVSSALYVIFSRTSGLVLRAGEADLEADLLGPMIRQVNADGGFCKYPGSPSSGSITRLALLAIRLSLGLVYSSEWPAAWLSRNSRLTPDLENAAAAVLERGEQFLRTRPAAGSSFDRDYEAFESLLEAYVTGGALRRGRAVAALRAATQLVRWPALAGLRRAVQPMFRGLLPACAILIDCVERRAASVAGGGPATSTSNLVDCIRSSQNAHGAWAYQPFFTIFNLVALSASGAPLDDGAVRRGVEYLRGVLHTSEDGGSFFTFMNTDVWTTAAATLALVQLPPAVLPAAAAAASIDWLLANQHEDGGFAFAAGSTNDPDTDSCGLATLTLAVARRQASDAPVDSACARGLACLLGRQSRGGGFSSFDRSWVPPLMVRDELVRYALFDPPVPDVTARALTALVALGLTTEHPSIRRGLRFLLRRQTAAGGWWSRWFAGYLSATGAVLYLFGDVGLAVGRAVPPGLEAAGVAMARGVDFVVSHQNPDGGWGETTAADADEVHAATGPSTPLRTATTVTALMHGGVDRDGAVVGRAMECLLAQAADGRWTDNEATLTVFPNLFYYYHPMLPTVTALLALGEYLRNR